MLSWLRSFGRTKRPELEVTLFTRTHCCLCEEAHALLEREQARCGFRIVIRNVDDDPQWTAEYGECVPVVLLDGKVRFRGRVNAVLLRRLLDAGG